ncbi:MAG: 7-carboxy-7-deazaguanine synthase QueE [Candidatus Paceibacterota bacterium]|jgi:organic radical activating enzyme
MNLKVNEIFSTFQGEGTNAGLPCTFLRLAMCNLHCKWCDTWYSWNFGKGDGIEEKWGSKTVRLEDELHELSPAFVAGKLIGVNTKNLVISGGEPMLQQNALIEMFCQVAADGYQFNSSEIETNGTVALDPRLNNRGSN